MTEFFCRSGPNEFGPLSVSQMKKLADAGRLAAGDEVRKGRNGRWVPAASLPGLFDPAIRPAEHAINEMDIVADAPAAVLTGEAAAREAERDTAIDEVIATEKRGISAVAERGRLPARARIDRRNGPLAAWSGAAAGLCYLSAAAGLAAGVAGILGAQNALDQVYAGLLLLVAIVGLIGGCAISLLRAIWRSAA